LTGGTNDPAVYGMALGVLFNKPVDETTANLATNYIAENNDVLVAKLQAPGAIQFYEDAGGLAREVWKDRIRPS